MTRLHLTIFFTIVLLTALVYSPFLLSLGMFGLAATAVLDLRRGVNPDWLAGLRRHARDPFLWCVTGFFWIVLLGGWQTESDWAYYFERLRIKVPFLAFPIIWVGLPRMGRREMNFLLAYLTGMLVVTCIGIGINYALHFQEINELIERGQAMPTPRNHIRFSLMVAIGMLAAGELGRVRYLNRRALWWALAVFLFLFLHLLSVRSGLLSAYGALAVAGIQYVFSSRRYLLGLGLLAGLVLIPAAAYVSMPTLRMKVNYTRYEAWRRAQGLEGDQYSDSGRLTSIYFGLDLWQRSPILGIGIGNLRQEVNEIYAERLPDAHPLMPHNQFVSVLAAHGILGLAFFLGILFYPLIYRKAYRDYLFLGFLTIIVLSFMVENTIENSIGAGIFLFFLLLFGWTRRNLEEERGKKQE